MLRADLVDPEISGNKAYKLRHNLAAAKAQGHDTLLSFGGPWSNHLHALAAAGQRFGWRTIGVIRGEAPAGGNACLDDLRRWGMSLHFVSRSAYRRRHEAAFLAELQTGFGHCYVIPEGGANLAGIRGCQQLLPAGSDADFDHVMLACGTGTTLAGIITSTRLRVTGIQTLKGQGYLQTGVERMLRDNALEARSRHWQVRDEFHRGGFGRVDTRLLATMAEFSAHTAIALEPLYSGKLVQALRDMAERGELRPDERLLLIHGGGLQGRRGFMGLAGA